MIGPFPAVVASGRGDIVASVVELDISVGSRSCFFRLMAGRQRLLQMPSTNRPGLKIPRGSSFSLIERITARSPVERPQTGRSVFHSGGQRVTIRLPFAAVASGANLLSIAAACSLVK